MTSAYIGVHDDGKIIYVLIDDRVTFDLIALPVSDHREYTSKKQLLTKTESSGPVYIVFQHWLKTCVPSFARGTDTETAHSAVMP